MVGYLWAICQKPLWVKWIHTSVIEGKCIQAIKTPSNASWTVRKLFQLRTIAQPWIKNIVGDSQNTFLWWENWHPMGPLYMRYGDSSVHSLGNLCSVKVSDIIMDDRWNWSRVRNPVIQDPASFLPNSHRPDSVIWTLHPSGSYSTKSAWSALTLRIKNPAPTWTKAVWFTHDVSRWAIVEWMAVQHRLTIKDRILHWGMTSESLCPLLYRT